MKKLGEAIERYLSGPPSDWKADEEWEREARAELRRLRDAALIARAFLATDGRERKAHSGGILRLGPLALSPHFTIQDEWLLVRWSDAGDQFEAVCSGPIVDGLPQLTPEARAALGEVE